MHGLADPGPVARREREPGGEAAERDQCIGHIRRRHDGQPERPEQQQPAADRELEVLLSKALAREPERRT